MATLETVAKRLARASGIFCGLTVKSIAWTRTPIPETLAGASRVVLVFALRLPGTQRRGEGGWESGGRELGVLMVLSPGSPAG